MTVRADGQTLSPITAAFYLPQFHQIAENDSWWGTGFTEWTNVRRATPLFPGHHQPNRPVGPYGEYDLTSPEVIDWQTRLAATNDIDAFIYYHYWFSGKRLLERPLDAYMQTPNHHKFAICWANENWTRRWDGKDAEVLIAQDYSSTTAADVFESFMPYLADDRYLAIDGRRVLFVHRVDHLPEPRRYASCWRELARRAGLGELQLIASETSHNLHPSHYGFDAVAEFPPVGDSTIGTALRRLPDGIRNGFRGRLNSYPALARRYMNRTPAAFVRYPCVIPRWDNTPRRMDTATAFIGSTPSRYAEWLRVAREREASARAEKGLVLINAWNEWAEGAYLEPDDSWGDAYLRATRCDFEPSREGAPHIAGGDLNMRGLLQAAASSVKNRLS